MPWLYLLLAGVFEIGWPLGFKMASVSPKHKILFIGLAIVSMALSGLLLYIAQKNIPIGTAYAVWTGVGAVGTLLIGIFCFHDPAGFLRLLSAGLIVLGVIGLRVF